MRAFVATKAWQLMPTSLQSHNGNLYIALCQWNNFIVCHDVA